jgi:hypothetical protein
MIPDQGVRARRSEGVRILRFRGVAPSSFTVGGSVAMARGRRPADFLQKCISYRCASERYDLAFALCSFRQQFGNCRAL